jgi:hypothetical protein
MQPKLKEHGQNSVVNAEQKRRHVEPRGLTNVNEAVRAKP